MPIHQSWILFGPCWTIFVRVSTRNIFPILVIPTLLIVAYPPTNPFLHEKPLKVKPFICKTCVCVLSCCHCVKRHSLFSAGVVAPHDALVHKKSLVVATTTTAATMPCRDWAIREMLIHNPTASSTTPANPPPPPKCRMRSFSSDFTVKKRNHHKSEEYRMRV